MKDKVENLKFDLYCYKHRHTTHCLNYPVVCELCIKECPIIGIKGDNCDCSIYNPVLNKYYEVKKYSIFAHDESDKVVSLWKKKVLNDKSN